MADTLILAVPSKGRLQENADAFFGRSGLVFARARGVRDYRGRIKGVDNAEVLFLSASEIAGELARGNVHLGVTGEDLIRENIPDADERLAFVTPLGFGHARVVVAVPQVWIDVDTMADLADVAQSFRARHGRRLRVATKYVNLTRAFFADKGVTDYRIVESLGATEGAPASGAADLIVDITTTGATLAANALKILSDGVMLESEANLVASVRADWSASAKAAFVEILDRVAAEEHARSTCEVRAIFAFPRSAQDAQGVATEQLGVDAIMAPRDGVLVYECAAGDVWALTRLMKARGAQHVSVRKMDYVFTAENPLVARIGARLGLTG
ncbi:MAG: ATP phosphoribosyltransferase [Tepidamorphaceae bacterium]|nr:ATP phosphoribosyltransferase [Rhodobiaceae bacterium]MCC0049033.1 ATP phosphoribosyltransferase [Rhodobiaceae bacterium]